MEKLELTVKSAKVLEILKDNGGDMIPADIAEVDAATFEKGARSVSPILVHLVKKGLVEKTGKADREVLNKDGNPETRSYTQYRISDFGKTAEYATKA